MNTMKICSGCQKPLEANAPDGLCPECLLKAGLGTGVDLGPDSQAEGGQVPFVAPTPEEREAQCAAARPDPEQGPVVRSAISAKKRLVNVS